jgi:hypothetical protein
MKPSGGMDISKVKFALKNSKGQKVATFTGKNGTVNILDGTAVDLTGIKDVDSYKAKNPPESRFLDLYYPDAEYKCNTPSGKLERNGKTYYQSADKGISVGPADEVYLTYTDKSNFNIVDTMTVPANKIVIDVDKKFLQTKNTYENCYFVPTASGQKCGITKDNLFKMYDHAGKRETISATNGKYNVGFTEVYGNTYCNAYDHSVKYSKIRVKFNDAFPGVADKNLKITENYKTSTKEFSVTYDLRGKMNDVAVSTVCCSGSVLTAFVPDSDGYVEFWVNDEDLHARMTYTFSYFVEVNGSWTAGSGGGSRVDAVLPKTREKISVLMEFPTSGYCIAALKPDKYTIVLEDKVDMRDYELSGASFTVTDTKKMQTANIKVNKKAILLGDVDRNGVINVNDVAVLAAHVRGIRVLNGRNLIAADVNESNSINVADIAALAAHVKDKRLLPNKTI